MEKARITERIPGFEFLLLPYNRAYAMPSFVDIQDTTIQNLPYKIVTYPNVEFFGSNKNGKIVLVDTFLVQLYINDNSGLPEKAISTRLHPELLENEHRTYIYTFQNLSFKNKDEEIQELMDFNQPKYANYRQYDNKIYPQTWSGPNADSVMNVEILNFPIVSVSTGNITSINKEQGWLLLDFWFFGCGSCKQWFEELKKEKDSLGSTFFEDNNIKIMAINALSANTEWLKKEAALYNALLCKCIMQEGLIKYSVCRLCRNII